MDFGIETHGIKLLTSNRNVAVQFDNITFIFISPIGSKKNNKQQKKQNIKNNKNKNNTWPATQASTKPNCIMITVVNLELHSDVAGATLTESASVRGQLTISVRSPRLSIPCSTMFKYRHLAADLTISFSPRADRLRAARQHQHHHSEATAAVASLWVDRYAAVTTTIRLRFDRATITRRPTPRKGVGIAEIGARWGPAPWNWGVSNPLRTSPPHMGYHADSIAVGKRYQRTFG